MNTIDGGIQSSNNNSNFSQDTKDSYFDGNTWQLIGYRLLSFFLSIITMGIAYPWLLCMTRRWEIKHTVINGRRLAFNGSGIQLIGKYLLWIFLTIITFGIYGIWFGLGMKKWIVKHTVYADEAQPADSHFSGGAIGFLGVHLLSFILTFFTLGIGKAWAEKILLGWEARHTHIGGSPLVFNGKGGQLFIKYLLLILLTPVTLGIYALFFPVVYKKWEIRNTMALYQKPEIQEKAKAHETAATKDYAKFRLAANDAEIAMLKSGYTGTETPEELETFVSRNNPYACYHQATLLKADAPVYETRALELLQIAADAKYHPAQLDLARQLPPEESVPMLEEAAKNGNAKAPWLLAVHYSSAGMLQASAYWFQIALEWGDEEASAKKDEYYLLLQKIAIQLSAAQAEKNSESSPVLVAVTVINCVLLGVVVGVFLHKMDFWGKFLPQLPWRRVSPKRIEINTEMIHIPGESAASPTAEESFPETNQTIDTPYEPDTFQSEPDTFQSEPEQETEIPAADIAPELHMEEIIIGNWEYCNIDTDSMGTSWLERTEWVFHPNGFFSCHNGEYAETFDPPSETFHPDYYDDRYWNCMLGMEIDGNYTLDGCQLTVFYYHPYEEEELLTVSTYSIEIIDENTIIIKSDGWDDKAEVYTKINGD